MSLLNDYEKICTRLDMSRTPDKEGGWSTEWIDGDSFVCRIAMDSDSEATRAEKDGPVNLIKGLMDADAPITYGDYFRVEATGKTYRLTMDPNDEISPASATFSYKYFTAERRDPPT